MGSTIPLDVYEELVAQGLCGYCVLRFTANRSERLYKLFESELNEALIPTDIISKNEQDTDKPDDGSPSGVEIAQRLRVMKETLAHRDVCTSCLDICPPNKAFFAFIAQTVRAADYEFEAFSHFKTLPASIILRQYGLWIHMREKFPQVAFFQQPTHENHIIELKEALRFSQPIMMAQEINKLRSIDNGSTPGDVATVYAEDSLAMGVPIDQEKPFPSPFAKQADTESLPMHTTRHEINSQKAFCTSLSPFHVHTVYHTDKPEYEAELRNIIAAYQPPANKRQRTHGNAMSVSGNLMRNIVKVPTERLRKLGLCPPSLPSTTLDPSQGTGMIGGGTRSALRKARQAAQAALSSGTADDETATAGDAAAAETAESDAERGVYTPMVPVPLPGLPLAIVAGIDATNGVPPGRVLQLSPFVAVEVSCAHEPVLLEGSYLKLSRMISHSSWYEQVEHMPTGLVEAAAAGAANGGAAATATDAPAKAAAPLEGEDVVQEEAKSNTTAEDKSEEKSEEKARKKKRFEDLEDSEDEEEASAALAELLSRKDDDDAVFAESSVEAELAYRVLPHFRPGNGRGYREFYAEKDQLPAGLAGVAGYHRGSLQPVGVNPYAVLQFSGYTFKFHSSGREDLNVRMLGNGRPFFLELVDPHRVPKLDTAALQALEREINAHSELVQVRGLRRGDDKSFAQMVKGVGEKRKKYRCFVHCEQPLSGPEALRPLNEAGDLQLTQLTPVRVLYRRAALARTRHVNNLRAQYLSAHWFILDLETQAGTYVKEFVHSDRGRTFPSVTSLLGVQCTIIQLDVTELVL